MSSALSGVVQAISLPPPDLFTLKADSYISNPSRVLLQEKWSEAWEGPYRAGRGK